MQQFQGETDFAEVSGKAPVGFSRVEIFVFVWNTQTVCVSV